MLRAAYETGWQAALTKFGASKGPPIQPVDAPGGQGPVPLPKVTKPVSSLKKKEIGIGDRAAKFAANVGMGFSSARHEGPGSVRGEPADEGRRQRSVIDRTFQANDDNFATSSMPAPGVSVSP